MSCMDSLRRPIHSICKSIQVILLICFSDEKKTAYDVTTTKLML